MLNMAKSSNLGKVASLCLITCVAFGQGPGKSVAPTGSPRSTSGADDARFWGYENTRVWRDVNHDGFVDFCRVIRTHQNHLALQCTLATGANIDQIYAGASFESEISAEGTLTAGHWAYMTKNDSTWFCRTISIGGRRGYLSCIPVLDGAFGTEVRSREAVDLGAASGRAWVDFNADGKPDFCTLVEQRAGVGNLVCHLESDQTFAEEPIKSTQMRWQPIASMRQWISNSQGTVNFCTVAGPGNRFVDCVASDGKAFGDIHRDLLDHGAVR